MDSAFSRCEVRVLVGEWKGVCGVVVWRTGGVVVWRTVWWVVAAGFGVASSESAVTKLFWWRVGKVLFLLWFSVVTLSCVIG